MPVVLVGGLMLLSGVLVVIGLQKSWQMTFGRIFVELAKVIYQTPSIGVRGVSISIHFLADALIAVNRAVYGWLGQAINYSSAPLAAFFRRIADVFEIPAREVSLLAADVLHTLNNYRKWIIPAMIAAAVGPIAAIAYALRAQVAHLPHTITRTATKTIVHTVTHVQRVVVHKATTVVLPRTRVIERDTAGLGKWIRKHSRLLSIAGLTAAVTAITARRFPMLRCRNVKQLSRSICGLPAQSFDHFLEALLLGALAIYGTRDLNAFGRELQKGLGEVEDAVTHFWRADLVGVTRNPDLGDPR